MSSTAISIPRPTRWPHGLVAVAAAVLVALIVTVSLVVANSGGGTAHLPTLRAGRFAPASVDCMVRAPGHAC
jgi:hypothetical protein